jgi:hypothetical protein
MTGRDHSFATRKPGHPAGVYEPMPLSVIQVVAALGAAVCIVIAFIAAGVSLISGFFMLLAVAALGFIAWTAIRRAMNQTKP